MLLAVLALALLAWREWAHGVERAASERLHAAEREALLDRVQAPVAAQMAALARADIPPAALGGTDAEDDERYGKDIPMRDDLRIADLIAPPPRVTGVPR